MRLTHDFNIIDGSTTNPVFSLKSERADIIPCKFNEATLTIKAGYEVAEFAELVVDVLDYLAEKTDWGHYQTLAYTAKHLLKVFSKPNTIDGQARDITNIGLLNGSS